ncbi:biotin/lipoyl-containing protein [Bradyrhizobium liaoningense]|uniref:biotin/lipoyl-containing protein n=1 Tax=Bradyrhizobium liaoningense TaxID=43992 RepID=UPI0028A0955B|nr:biotin/lipoyl-containing protein [Bradyrhizobium liaoningense]
MSRSPKPIEVVLPDIGDYKDVPVVEINVSVGDEVTIDMPLLSIESDKATMEVPSPAAGTVAKLMIDVGVRVSQGSVLMVLEGRGESTAPPPATASAPQVEQRISQQEALSRPAPVAPVDDSRARAQQPQLRSQG